MKLLLRFKSFIKSLFSKKAKTNRDEDLEERMKKARKNDPFIYR